MPAWCRSANFVPEKIQSVGWYHIWEVTSNTDCNTPVVYLFVYSLDILEDTITPYNVSGLHIHLYQQKHQTDIILKPVISCRMIFVQLIEIISGGFPPPVTEFLSLSLSDGAWWVEGWGQRTLQNNGAVWMSWSGASWLPTTSEIPLQNGSVLLCRMHPGMIISTGLHICSALR